MHAFYPKNLPGTLVVSVQEQLTAVPMRADGWDSRFPYLGHEASLVAVEHHEAEIQLRTTGWTGADFVACPCGDLVPTGTLAPVPDGETDVPHCAMCRQAAAESL